MSAERAVDRQHVRNLIGIGRYDEARAALGSAIASDPDDVELHGLIALAFIGLDDAPSALQAANAVVRVAPDDEWGHRLASIALSRMGRYDDALLAAAEAVRLGPHTWQTHARFAEAAVDVRGRLLDALAAAQRAAELAPNEPGVQVLLGITHHARSEFEDARAAYQRALSLDPDDATARNNLAVLDGSLRLGNQTRGFLAALRSDPGSELIQQNLEAFLPGVFLRLWLAFGTGLVIALLVTIRGASLDDSDPSVASYTLLGSLLIGSVVYVVSLVRLLPPGVLGELARRSSRDPLVWLSLIATVVMIGGVAVVCLVPDSGRFGVKLLRSLFTGLIILGVVWYVRRERRT